MLFLVGTISTAAGADCRSIAYRGDQYAVCEVDPALQEIRLFLNRQGGRRFGQFNEIGRALAVAGERLELAMNGGMYHRDRTPVGLYIEDGVQLTSLNTRPGPGNFHLLPNGVFFVLEDGVAGVLDAKAYRDAAQYPLYATQSGPMLVIDGEVHPRFIPESDSLKRRNGVGVRTDGRVVFAISDGAVNFHDFATFFRDEMKTPNALYLDGVISRLYAPALGRDDPGPAMGPVIGVVVED
ncbi:MAG: hypothetical protein GC152_02995 [Alphaproteobacteria bacterium]|nr:hypothetical protein [Alphaproteobacteria bacterium]